MLENNSILNQLNANSKIIINLIEKYNIGRIKKYKKKILYITRVINLTMFLL